MSHHYTNSYVKILYVTANDLKSINSLAPFHSFHRAIATITTLTKPQPFIEAHVARSPPFHLLDISSVMSLQERKNNRDAPTGSLESTCEEEHFPSNIRLQIRWWIKSIITHRRQVPQPTSIINTELLRRRNLAVNQLTRRIELLLYKRARSMTCYANLSTLESRVVLIAKEMLSKANRKYKRSVVNDLDLRVE